MNPGRHPELCSRLAAEYVLGTLRGRARRRFEHYLQAHAALAADVLFWRERFAEFGHRLTPVKPRERVWERLHQQLHRENSILDLLALDSAAADALPLRRIDPVVPAARRPATNGLWLGWAVAASITALGLGVQLWIGAQSRTALERQLAEARHQLLVATVAPRPVKVAELPYVGAALSASGAQWTLLLYPGERRMHVRYLAGKKPLQLNAKSLELWRLDAAGTPHSLGLLPTVGEDVHEMPLPEIPAAELKDHLQLAISLEPAGGSPTGLPTGEVLMTLPAIRAL